MSKRKSSRSSDNFRIELTKIQKTAENFLRDNEISIFHGNAGTGKDFIQLHRALTGLIQKEFENIIFMRTAVEVGKGIGFLPGLEKDKLQPYEESFYSNLYKMLDKGVADRLRSKIHFEHVGFSRGKTFDHSCIILSEAQNCTLHELITVTTRFSTSSKMLINGDKYQSDIRNSGFKDFINIVKDINGVGVMHLGDEYQMRNPMIVDIDKNYKKFLKNGAE